MSLDCYRASLINVDRERDARFAARPWMHEREHEHDERTALTCTRRIADHQPHLESLLSIFSSGKYIGPRCREPQNRVV